MKHRDTSWHKAGSWYQSIVGTTGQFFHKAVIFPKILTWIPKKPQRIIDFGCGTGIATQFIPQAERYTGYDNAKHLLEYATKHARRGIDEFRFGDATKPLPNIEEQFYTCALSILSIQNMEQGDGCVRNAARALAKGGLFIIVLNHPCFRIPRQTSWEADEKNNTVYRRINGYLSPIAIPITTHPGKARGSSITWSFHHSLEDYVRWLHDSGFVISSIAELTSPKESEGKRAREENRSRREFPLFLALCAVKT